MKTQGQLLLRTHKGCITSCRLEGLQPGARKAISGSAGAAATYLVLRGLCKAFRTVKRRTLRSLLFHAVLPALNRAGVINYYIDFGSLLGIYRKGDILKFDNDTDIVILDLDAVKLLQELPKHLPKGFTVSKAGSGKDLGGGVQASWVRVYAPNKIFWCDLFGGYIQGDKIRITKGPDTDLLTPMVLPIKQLSVKGHEVPVPADVEMVLRTRYGPDWRIDKYAEKGSDLQEHNKLYLRLLRGFGKLGLRV